MRNAKAVYRAVASVSIGIVITVVASHVSAATIYWDINGTGIGAGDTSTPSGTWDTTMTANWSTAVAGDAASQTYTAAGGGNATDVVFSAGTNATGAYTVTMGSSGVAARGLTFEEGNVSIVGTNGVNVRAGGITVLAGAGPVAIGNVSGATGLLPQGNQTWANYSGNKLTIGAANVQYTLGQVFTLAVGDIQLGNDGTNNQFYSTAGSGTFKVDGANLIWSLNSSGIGANSLEFKSGTLTNSSRKGLGKGFLIDGSFTFAGGDNAWRDVTINGAAGLSPIVTVNTTGTGTTTFTGYGLIGTAANQSLTLAAASGRTIGVGFNAGANNPGLILDDRGAGGSYNLATAASTLAGGMTLKSGTVTITGNSTITGGTLTSGPAGVGLLRLAGGTIQASAASTLSNSLSLDGNVTFGGSQSLKFDTVTGLTTPGTITLTGNRTFTISASATPTIVGAIGEDTPGRGFTKAGTGKLTLGAGEASPNTYTGLTTVSAGELDLAKAAGAASISGDLNVQAGGLVKLLAADQIADSSQVTVAGSLNLNGLTETIGTLDLISGGSLFGGGTISAQQLRIDGTPFTPTKDTYTSADFPWIGSGTTLSVPVPEPVAGSLLGLGTLLALRRRKHP